MALDPPVTLPLGISISASSVPPGHVLPVVVAIPDALGRLVAVLDLLREAVDVRVVRTRL